MGAFVVVVVGIQIIDQVEINSWKPWQMQKYIAKPNLDATFRMVAMSTAEEKINLNFFPTSCNKFVSIMLTYVQVFLPS